jgi:hypothetical protein
MKKSLFAVITTLVITCSLWRCHSPTPPRQASPAPNKSTPDKSQPNLQNPASSNTVQSDSTSARITTPEGRTAALLASAYNTPIDFWGKAVDDTGRPVPGASVHFVVSDKYFEDGSDYDTTADTKGLFSLTGVKGLSISVRVTKPGYYLMQNESRATIAYGYRTDAKDIRPPPTKDQPSIFVLRKAHPNTGLKIGTGRRVILPQDGKPVAVRLDGHNTASPGMDGALVIETQLDLTRMNELKQFPWRCRLSVPGGGLITRTDKLDFEAPDSGYLTEEIILMNLPHSKSDRWSSIVERDFFLKLPGNHFGRISIKLDIDERATHNWLHYSGAWDPTGSKNLEIGPDDHGNPR